MKFSPPSLQVLYAYTSDLLALHGSAHSSSSLDPRILEVHTPLIIPACLRTHPDTDFAHYILHGLQHGFHIGATRPLKLQSAKTNMSSAKQHPEVIEDYL